MIWLNFRTEILEISLSLISASENKKKKVETHSASLVKALSVFTFFLF